jgi:FKBP-type peptidyl-prolyl cis-trans isomerase FklB
MVLGGMGALSAQENDEKLTQKERSDLGYAYGAQMGSSLKAATMLTTEEKDVDQFIEGFQDGLKGDAEMVAKAKKEIQIRIQSKVQSTTAGASNKVAYNIGVTSGLSDVAQKVAIPVTAFDFKAMKKGYQDGLTKEKEALDMTQAEMDLALKTYLQPKFDEYQAIMKAEEEAKAAKVIEAGEAFLAENKKKEGVITTASGLQYEIIKAGTGTKPTLADKVKTHYHGTLIDGSIFDSSVDRGAPATFPVGGVIKGWQEGIPLMSEGAKYRFYIPQGLAYGMQSPSPKIPAGAVLIFDVELIEINPK